MNKDTVAFCIMVGLALLLALVYWLRRRLDAPRRTRAYTLASKLIIGAIALALSAPLWLGVLYFFFGPSQ